MMIKGTKLKSEKEMIFKIEKERKSKKLKGLAKKREMERERNVIMGFEESSDDDSSNDDSNSENFATDSDYDVDDKETEKEKVIRERQALDTAAVSLAAAVAAFDKCIGCFPQRVDLIIDDFRPDRQALLSAMRGDPRINIRNGGTIWKILSASNYHFHWMYAGLGQVWCRTIDIRSQRDLGQFIENIDYFKSEESFNIFVHNQLTAHGDNVPGLIKLGAELPVDVLAVKVLSRGRQNRDLIVNATELFEIRTKDPYKSLKCNFEEPSENLYSLECAIDSQSPVVHPPTESSSSLSSSSSSSSSVSSSSVLSLSSSSAAAAAVAVAATATASEYSSILSPLTLRETIKLARAQLDVKNNPYPTERNRETKEIRKIITNSLQTLYQGKQSGNSFDLKNAYVCGLPGYGKTLTVEKLLNKMITEQNERNAHRNNQEIDLSVKKRKISETIIMETLPQFRIVDISGTIVHSDTFYQLIASRLDISLHGCGSGVMIEKAAREKVLRRFRNEQQCLNNFKGDRGGRKIFPITILMIDEIDKAPQKAIKELFEIVAHATSDSSTSTSDSSSSSSSSLSSTSNMHSSQYYPCSLILIGVANDLTYTCKLGISYNASERINVIPFKPYDIPELQSILNKRSKGLFDSRATYLIAARGSRSEGGERETFTVNNIRLKKLIIIICYIPSHH